MKSAEIGYMSEQRTTIARAGCGDQYRSIPDERRRQIEAAGLWRMGDPLGNGSRGFVAPPRLVAAGQPSPAVESKITDDRTAA